MFDPEQYFVAVEAELLYVSQNESQTSLVPCGVVALITLEFVADFVDRVIRQVHKKIRQVARVRLFVLLSRESTETLVVKVDP